MFLYSFTVTPDEEQNKLDRYGKYEDTNLNNITFICITCKMF